MALKEKKVFHTEEEYLKLERFSENKNELLDGEIYSMTGASYKHNLISGNIFSSIHQNLKKTNCKIFMSDMRVKISSKLYTYPDLSIVCGEIKFSDDHLDSILNPNCIIEILSNSTESYDRGKKFLNYQKIPSLKEYILVSQETKLIEKYQKIDSGNWEYSVLSKDNSSLTLSCINFSLSFSHIYEGV